MDIKRIKVGAAVDAVACASAVLRYICAVFKFDAIPVTASTSQRTAAHASC